MKTQTIKTFAALINVVDDVTRIVVKRYCVTIPTNGRRSVDSLIAKAIRLAEDNFGRKRIAGLAEDLNITESDIAEVLLAYRVSFAKGYAFEIDNFGWHIAEQYDTAKMHCMVFGF